MEIVGRFDPSLATEWTGYARASDSSSVPWWLDLKPINRFLNVGSGQRRFDVTDGWLNVDLVSRPPDQVPDLICDASNMDWLPNDSVQHVCLHHVLEHFGCGEAEGLIRECWRVVRPEGSLMIFVPNMRVLASHWVDDKISDFTFMVNAYGAYQGKDSDRHKWGYSWATLYEFVRGIVGQEAKIEGWNNRYVQGALIAWDWWILGMEVVKQ